MNNYTTVFHTILGVFLILMSAWQVQGQNSEGMKKTKNQYINKVLPVPQLEAAPIIDGNLDEWKSVAFSDGRWDIERVRHSEWYQAKRNRITKHREDDFIEDDLSARYYMAWDSSYFYFGAEVTDNFNDVTETKHAQKRWYYKDAIAWFLEAPKDTVAEKFVAGNHAFCFVIDTLRPDYGAWWRHGSDSVSYIEEPLPNDAVDYEIRMSNEGRGDFVLEARVDIQATFGANNPDWQPPQTGDTYGIMIVHCDPDGGEYGGHLLIYGKNDNDANWGTLQLSKPQSEILRKIK